MKNFFFFIPTDEFIREHPKSIIDWEKFPKLKLVLNKNEIIDVLALRNTKKVEQTLNNPDNYSLNDLLKITKEDLKEVNEELIKQLFKLVKEKVRRKFTSLEEDEGYYSDDEKKNKEDNLFRKVYQEEEKRQEQIQTSITNLKPYWSSKGITNLALEDILEDWEESFNNKEQWDIALYEDLLKKEIDYWANQEQNSSPEDEGYHLGNEEEKETPPTTPPSEDEDVYEFNEEESKRPFLFLI